MVGRELLTICPKGEDHQGHDWGGTEWGGWRSRCGWRSWIVTMMRMACFWILFLMCKGLEGRNCDWYGRGTLRVGNDLVTMNTMTTSANTQTTTGLRIWGGIRIAGEHTYRSLHRETKKTYGWRRPWTGYDGHRCWGGRGSICHRGSWKPLRGGE